MLLSKYCVIVPDYPYKGQHVVFHTGTQALVLLDSQALSYLKNEIRLNTLPPKKQIEYQKMLPELRQMGILVKDQQEDAAYLESFFDQLKRQRIRKTWPVTILTTDACNFQCVYCFEENARRNIAMNLEVQTDTLAFIKNRMTSDKYERLYVTFYGGEPLLKPAVITHLASNLKNWSKKAGVVFEFMLQTNGYLLSPNLVRSLIPLGLDQVRVSLDGPRDVHDARRPLRSGGRTFDTIIKNILASMDSIKICVSVCYEKDHLQDIDALLSFLKQKNMLHQLGRFIFSPIHPRLGTPEDKNRIQHFDCMINYQDANLVQSISVIRDILKTYDVDDSRKGLAISACPLMREKGGLTIDPCGYIYKCNSMIGFSKFSVGQVKDAQFNPRADYFVSLDPWRSCPNDCPYLPLCGGGCRMSAYFKYKDFKELDCHRDYLDQMIPVFIKEEYTRLTTEKQYSS
ncbi:MAG: radical SAM protein [Candidatus Omnitrophica bacterium]|nr:radical SAM protein [Candidatus Omnitrophota bacterium]